MGFTLLVAVIYVVANLIVDLLYALVDPRVKLGGG
jgi:peptide/nickel transport system permease protein